MISSTTSISTVKSRSRSARITSRITAETTNAVTALKPISTGRPKGTSNSETPANCCQAATVYPAASGSSNGTDRAYRANPGAGSTPAAPVARTAMAPEPIRTPATLATATASVAQSWSSPTDTLPVTAMNTVAAAPTSHAAIAPPRLPCR